MNAVRRAPVVLLALLCGSHSAAAQHRFIAPLGGVTAGTETGFIDLDGAAAARKPAIVLAGGWQGDGWLGAECEVMLLPAFFEGAAGLVTSSRVATLSGNVLVSPWRAGRIRPYLAIGAGVASVRVADVADVFSISATLAAINGGAGLVVDLNSRLGLRADLRHFRSRFDDPPPGTSSLGARFVHSWRIGVGLVARF